MSGCGACYADNAVYRLEMTSERYPTWKWDICFRCQLRIIEWVLHERPKEILGRPESAPADEKESA